jgi:hypothetical protein
MNVKNKGIDGDIWRRYRGDVPTGWQLSLPAGNLSNITQVREN